MPELLEAVLQANKSDGERIRLLADVLDTGGVIHKTKKGGLQIILRRIASRLDAMDDKEKPGKVPIYTLRYRQWFITENGRKGYSLGFCAVSGVNCEDIDGTVFNLADDTMVTLVEKEGADG